MGFLLNECKFEDELSGCECLRTRDGQGGHHIIVDTNILRGTVGQINIEVAVGQVWASKGFNCQGCQGFVQQSQLFFGAPRELPSHLMQLYGVVKNKNIFDWSIGRGRALKLFATTTARALSEGRVSLEFYR